MDKSKITLKVIDMYNIIARWARNIRSYELFKKWEFNSNFCILMYNDVADS